MITRADFSIELEPLGCLVEGSTVSISFRFYDGSILIEEYRVEGPILHEPQGASLSPAK
jgi:hypothetical protein